MSSSDIGFTLVVDNYPPTVYATALDAVTAGAKTGAAEYDVYENASGFMVWSTNGQPAQPADAEDDAEAQETAALHEIGWCNGSCPMDVRPAHRFIPGLQLDDPQIVELQPRQDVRPDGDACPGHAQGRMSQHAVGWCDGRCQLNVPAAE